ncbi:MAG: PIN domain-containing protein [Caldilineaceae bacterium SB0665_bin_25]|nr:PIN domain-containing protein [Caldilineaceae bacterium SB0665_bin_25]
MVLVDTSALIALLNREDRYHDDATLVWRRLVLQDEPVICTNYVVVEAIALVQRRLGLAAVRRLLQDLIPWLSIEWVQPEIHEVAISVLLAANRRGLSIVDCVSFEVARRKRVSAIFAYDRDFVEHGFTPID